MTSFKSLLSGLAIGAIALSSTAAISAPVRPATSAFSTHATSTGAISRVNDTSGTSQDLFTRRPSGPILLGGFAVLLGTVLVVSHHHNSSSPG